MAVKKTTRSSQNCNYGSECPPQHGCVDGKCVPWPKKPGAFSTPSAKIAATIIGAGLSAIGTRVGKNIKENRAAKKEAKKVTELPKQKKGGNWIQGAIKKPGALREQLGVKKGEKIPKAKLAAAAKKGGKLGQRARLAVTLSKMRKK
jgi:hypothetical protein